jgi:hypothetical protein
LAQFNADRRQLEAKMQQEALEQLDIRVTGIDGKVGAGICVFDATWHQGVIGLVASRVKEKLHRPVIAFAPADPGWVKGSARSCRRTSATWMRSPQSIPACSTNSVTRWQRACSLREEHIPSSSARLRRLNAWSTKIRGRPPAHDGALLPGLA